MDEFWFISVPRELNFRVLEKELRETFSKDGDLVIMSSDPGRIVSEVTLISVTLVTAAKFGAVNGFSMTGSGIEGFLENARSAARCLKMSLPVIT